MNFALRIYRRLARAFPHEFKLAYGEEVLDAGQDAIEHIARRHGTLGLVRLLADIAFRVPIEYAAEMRRDVRYAARALYKSPGFALVGILSMGLSFGITTNVYTSKWQTLFRRLPAANADQLFMPEKLVSYSYIEQFREERNVFSGVVALENGVPFNVTFQGDFGGKPQRVLGQLVSPDYFSVLGVQPQFGRMLSPALDRPGTESAVVVSDRFWRNRLNSSTAAIGQTLRLNGYLTTIVGIAPEHFNGAIPDIENPPELFVPITVPSALAPELANDALHQRSAKDFLAVLCLERGVTPENAAVALDTIMRHLDEQDASIPLSAASATRTVLYPLDTELPIPKKLRRMIIGFFIVLMGLIVTIACMNLANMLLARGANRRKEFAVRLSIGASRFRLIRQMITEGVLLAVLGAVAGYPLAVWLSALYSRSRLTAAASAPIGFVFSWRAAIFVFGLAIVCGIAFSIAPALRATKSDLAVTLKEGSALQLPGYRRIGLRNILMVAQVAASLMLLLITGFLVVGVKQQSRIQTKFDPGKMYLFSADPAREGYSLQRTKAFLEGLPRRLLSVPEVQSVALAAQPPFAVEDEDSAVPVRAEIRGDASKPASRVQISAIEESIGANYFATLSELLVAGREFDERDQRAASENASPVPVILNESASRGFFGNESSIGRHIQDDKRSYEVIGVVRNLHTGLGASRSIMYLPLTARDFARPPADGITVMVRASSSGDALTGIRQEVAAKDPEVGLFNVRTLAEYLDHSRAAERFSIDTYAGIGLFGLILAAIGLSGITAYTVSQRSKEIGIRMALGARTGQVLREVLRESTALVLVGTVVGLAGGYALAKSLAALIDVFAKAFQVGAGDLRLVLCAPLLLGAVALLACFVPARRATKIDPLKALRQG